MDILDNGSETKIEFILEVAVAHLSLLAMENAGPLLSLFFAPRRALSVRMGAWQVSGSNTRLVEHMAVLLAHPAQRDADQDTFIEKMEAKYGAE